MKFESDIIVGRVEGLFCTTEKSSFVTTEQDGLNFELDGLAGDRHGGFTRLSSGREKKYYTRNSLTRNNRQWSAVSVEEMAVIEQNMGIEIDPVWLGPNLLVSGIPNFSQLPPLSHLFIGDDRVSLVVFEWNGPCSYVDEVIRENSTDVNMSFPKAAKGIRGLVGWVDKAGHIKKGDRIEVWIPERTEQ